MDYINSAEIEDFINGSAFHRVLSNSIKNEVKKNIKRLIICSGKIYFELQDRIDELHLDHIHILRLEQIYPFPYMTLQEELEQYKDCEIVWCQEEPKNMGAWEFVKDRINIVIGKIISQEKNIHFIGRKAAASPATGVFDRHLANQKNLIRLATEANMKEIEDEEDGVSLVKYKLPIE